MVPDRPEETATKGLKLSLASEKVKHNKENMQWESVNTLVKRKIREQRGRLEGGESRGLSPTKFCTCM